MQDSFIESLESRGLTPVSYTHLPIDTDDATGRANMIGELVDTLAAATRQIERHLIVQAAGNEHLATTVETA